MRAILTAVLLIALAVSPAASPAQSTDHSLVLEALQALQTNYVDAVDTIKTLNAAITGLRAELSAAGIPADLPAIPSYATDADARRQFGERFTIAVAAAAGQRTRTQLAYAAIRGMTDGFNDSHTGFLTPEQNLERRQRQRGQAGFTGVGVVLMPKDDKFFVWTLIPGGPAQAAGVHEFDRIQRINDISTGGMSVDQVSSMIRGAAGTPVTLTLQRAGVAEPLAVTIVRAPILVPSIFKTELLDGGIGYIRLYQFVERTGRDVRAALTGLQAQGMRALVLDLRGNSGGYLHELNSVLNALLPFGLPVYTEMRQGGSVRVVRTMQVPLVPPTLPVVLMVDEGSASAAELLAAAIKENHRGSLVGVKTSGAVEASVTIDLSDGSSLSITTFRLATGRGVRLEGAGVEPDVAAELTLADLEGGTDRQLVAAVRLARQVIAEPAR